MSSKVVVNINISTFIAYLFSLFVCSPSYEFTIYEVPLKYIHIEDVKVERVGLHTVQFAISTNLRLPLIEI